MAQANSLTRADNMVGLFWSCNQAYSTDENICLTTNYRRIESKNWRREFGKVVPWLMLNREGLDILVHPTTGDDLADHTDHALWLGEKLELNIEFLQ